MSLADVLAAIDAAAARHGVPIPLAEAIADHESGFNVGAIGDQGSSFGLYQLHRGGELGSLSPSQAFDPRTNADVALAEVGRVYAAHPGWDPGEIAAAAQRPADPTGYAHAVDQLLAGHPHGWSGGSSTSTGSSSSTVATATTGLSLASSTSSAVRGVLVTGLFVLLGVGLLGAGAWHTASSGAP